MFLTNLFADFNQYLHSDSFLNIARNPDSPSAFVRKSKLPLPTLISIMLCGMRSSIQAELDQFFGYLHQQGTVHQQVSERAFRKARAHVSGTVFQHLNHWLLDHVNHLVPRWRGFRLVGADASNLQFGIRDSQVKNPADVDQKVFALCLLSADIVLTASLYSPRVGERQMLFEHLDQLGSADLLLLDRGYPASWLVSVLNARDQPFCMRVDSTGFRVVQEFARSGRAEQVVTLPSPASRDVRDYECSPDAPYVRLVRQVTPGGKIRVLMTNLMDSAVYPPDEFGQLYLLRWRVEEVFKRLKHRLKLEHVSGLSQLAACQDLTAKVTCDTLHGIVCLATRAEFRVNSNDVLARSYAMAALRPVLPRLLLGYSGAERALHETMALLSTNVHRRHTGRSFPRAMNRIKPHLYGAYKP